MPGLALRVPCQALHARPLCRRHVEARAGWGQRVCWLCMEQCGGRKEEGGQSKVEGQEWRL